MIAFPQTLRTVLVHKISVLSDVVYLELISIEQVSGEHGSVVNGLVVITALIDADFDADAAGVAAVFGQAIASLITDFIIGQMVVDFLSVNGVMPSGGAINLLFVVEKGIVIAGGSAGCGVAGLVNNDPFDIPLDTGTSGIAFGDKIGIDGNSTDGVRVDGDLLPVETAAGQHDQR